MRRYFLVGCCLCCLAAKTAAAELKPFVFENDFETGVALDIKPLLANGKYKVNFTGITEEAAFAGKKSFKLEITAETGNFYCWLIPFKVPAEGRLQFSCRYRVEAAGKGSFGPGVSFCFPAIPFDSRRFFTWKHSTDGGWEWLNIDLVAFAKRRITNRAWEVNDDNLLGYFKGMVLVIRGVSTGETVAVYIDDLKITGEVPAMTAAFDQQAEAKWQPAKEKARQRINSIITEVQEDREFLASFTNLPPVGVFLATVAKTNLSVCQALADAAGKRGYVLEKEIKTGARVRGRVNDLLANVASLSALETHRRKPKRPWWRFW